MKGSKMTPPIPRREFQAQLLVMRRVLKPVGGLTFAFILSSMFGLFPLLERLGAARDVALVICLAVVPTGLIAASACLVWCAQWHHRLFCPQRCSWATLKDFVSHVSQHGRCPRCEAQVIGGS